MKETNEARIRNLLMPIKNLLALVECLKENNDENIYSSLKTSDVNQIAEENCDRIIKIAQESDKKNNIESFFKVQNEIKRIVNKIVAKVDEHPQSGINDISRGKKSFKVCFWRFFFMNFREYHIEIPFEALSDNKMKKEIIEKYANKLR